MCGQHQHIIHMQQCRHKFPIYVFSRYTNTLKEIIQPNITRTSSFENPVFSRDFLCFEFIKNCYENGSICMRRTLFSIQHSLFVLEISGIKEQLQIKNSIFFAIEQMKKKYDIIDTEISSKIKKGKCRRIKWRKKHLIHICGIWKHFLN